MQRTHLTSKLFMPVLLLSLLTFGLSFNRYVITPSVGVNAYLVILIGFLIAIFSLFVIKSLAVKYPDQTIIHMGNKLLGPLGKIGAPVWLIIIFLLTALLTRRVTDEVATIILFRTPRFVTTLAFLLIAGYMASLGEEALGRLSSALMIMVPLFLMLLLISYRQVNFLNIHPVNIHRDLGYLKKWDLWLLIFTPVWVFGAFYGNESLRNNFKGIILTITGGALILGATYLAVAGAFGPKGNIRYEWPVMSLMNITELAPNYLFQNFITTFFFLVFLSFALVNVAGFIIVISKGFSEFLGARDSRSKLILLLIITALFILTASTTLINYKETADPVLKVGGFYTFGYVLLIWFGSLFHGKEQR
ncbi:MAG: GerAB/ArcD/ProY family transporter [Firmicutes bacterium]|nr:GerAB/ArcD/ProY family transporter [Bacillota bacterium]